MIHQSGWDVFAISALTFWVSRPPGWCLSGRCIKMLLLTGYTQTLHTQKHGQTLTHFFLAFPSREPMLKTAPMAVFPSSKHHYGNWLEDCLSRVQFISNDLFYLYVRVRTTLHMAFSPGNSAFVLPPEISLAFLRGTTESVNVWGSALSLSLLSPAGYGKLIIC